MRVKLSLFGLIFLVGAIIGSCGKGSPPPAAAVAGTPRIAFVGSKNSNIYHRATCRSAGKIAAGNLVTFSSREDAVSKGYRACEVCKP